MHVAIQGELGSFSSEAAAILVPEASILACATAADVLRALEKQEAEAAVVPVENSLAGSVVDFYDLFFEHAISIRREIFLRIRHNLIVMPGVRMNQLRRALSHPVALAQCKRFFAEHPEIEPAAFYDTAGSVKHMMQQQDRESGAIASKYAAMRYGAEILAEGIEDREENFTRFWLIRRQPAAPPPIVSGDGGADETPNKFSLVFSLENRPGTLLQALSAFAEEKLNLTRIESRPMPGRPWEYMFYVDLTIRSHAEADRALERLRAVCATIKDLGRYRSLGAE